MAEFPTAELPIQSTSPDVDIRTHRFISAKLLRRLGVATLALMASGGVAYGADALVSSGSIDSQTAIENVDINSADCNNPNFQVVPPSAPGSEAVLPPADLSSSSATEKTEAGWFSSGPLGTLVDKGMLATAYATTAKPASQSNVANATSANYSTWFSNAKSSFSSTSNVTEACTAVGNLLNQDSEYGVFASAGATDVEEVLPTFGSDGEIDSIQLVPYAVTTQLEGLVVEKNADSKGENDYPAVAFVSFGDGVREFLRGVSPVPQSGGSSETSSTTTSTSSPSSSSSSSASSSSNGGGGSGETSGSATGESQNGQNAGSASGPASGGPGATPGGGGPSGPGETTTQPTAPEETTTPPTTPEETTIPTTQPPTTTTSAPKNPVDGCDPNITTC